MDAAVIPDADEENCDAATRAISAHHVMRITPLITPAMHLQYSILQQKLKVVRNSCALLTTRQQMMADGWMMPGDARVRMHSFGQDALGSPELLTIRLHSSCAPHRCIRVRSLLLSNMEDVQASAETASPPHPAVAPATQADTAATAASVAAAESVAAPAASTPQQSAAARRPPALKGEDAWKRMNFLYQSAHRVALFPQRVLAFNLSRAYLQDMKRVASKLVLRIDPSVKSTVCRRCGVLLLPGLTASTTVTHAASAQLAAEQAAAEAEADPTAPAAAALPPMSAEEAELLRDWRQDQLAAASAAPAVSNVAVAAPATFKAAGKIAAMAAASSSAAAAPPASPPATMTTAARTNAQQRRAQRRAHLSLSKLAHTPTGSQASVTAAVSAAAAVPAAAAAVSSGDAASSMCTDAPVLSASAAPSSVDSPVAAASSAAAFATASTVDAPAAASSSSASAAPAASSKRRTRRGRRAPRPAKALQLQPPASIARAAKLPAMARKASRGPALLTRCCLLCNARRRINIKPARVR